MAKKLMSKATRKRMRKYRKRLENEFTKLERKLRMHARPGGKLVKPAVVREQQKATQEAYDKWYRTFSAPKA
jgi:hypothetical protein